MMVITKCHFCGRGLGYTDRCFFAQDYKRDMPIFYCWERKRAWYDYSCERCADKWKCVESGHQLLTETK